MLKRFLRYNVRHNLYYHPTYAQRGGAKVFFGWSLNPIGSCYDGKQKSFSEPLWAFRLRQKLFAYGGAQRCPERGGVPNFDGRNAEPLPDTWDYGPDGNRTCSFCGSLHFDDLMAICAKVLADERYAIEGTTKAYKVYVTQPGVRNAAEGAIKYYKYHTPADVSDRDQALFASAAAASAARFRERLRARYPEAVNA